MLKKGTEETGKRRSKQPSREKGVNDWSSEPEETEGEVVAMLEEENKNLFKKCDRLEKESWAQEEALLIVEQEMEKLKYQKKLLERELDKAKVVRKHLEEDLAYLWEKDDNWYERARKHQERRKLKREVKTLEEEDSKKQEKRGAA